MLFPTVEYALFFLLSLGLGWGLLRWHRAHKLVLLGLSYVFYGFWDWHFVPMLFVLSCWAWACTRGIQSRSLRRLWLILGVTGSLGLLAHYKYSAFFLESLVDLAALAGFKLELAVSTPMLPLGISFMTFHAISLMMDAWRRKLADKVDFADSLLYVAFFPQLIAGPILRASHFLPQLKKRPDPARIETGRALLLIVAGLFKKVVLANTLATLLVDDVFANPAAMSASQVLLGIYGYAAQIYCDFSGYTDIAIGCALLLGYRFPLNFDSPYKAASPQEFWRRWHISLSSWLRDYLYIPLGGSRKGAWRTRLNLFVTMLLGGLWHGAAWNFVLWGAWHGLLLAGHRQWEDFWGARAADWRRSGWWKWCARLLCFNAICLGWVLFRAGSLSEAQAVLAQLWQGEWSMNLPLGPLLCAAAGIGLQYLPERFELRLQIGVLRLQPLLHGAVFALALVLIEVLGPSEPAPFIYFQF
ncbi:MULTISPECIES: MBOAT family protein [unclassified Uliginosibacterium]|uniref:MBOAT family O-acyltransferase n=1 Tax=unclassified Uliginosibacterium TaxID=2621521 RepID=UPI000C7CE99F|nr:MULTISPECIES: MBOAT family O-acyltransferase [unclassified Uliginosibacterium]MDO6384954.1 MBOAT family O-acyltransferase [Uliginosibacterium sp. 31-12]PLK48643.1 MBOAT family protein [Uliginosibacterium sp. TH139]